MPDTKQVKCSVCGASIKTMSGALPVPGAALVCRRCFGEQTYAGGVGATPQHRSPGEG